MTSQTTLTDTAALADNELALSLFPECRWWLEEEHIYDHTPEMYISVYFWRIDDLRRQYNMIRYMELRPSAYFQEHYIDPWYYELRKRRYRSDEFILPDVPDWSPTRGYNRD